jgi:hypothetical protein
METRLERKVRILEIYAALATLLGVVFVVSGFAMQDSRPKFEEINVERLNIVEKDGQIKMVISNEERLPGPGNVVTGKFFQRNGLKGPGILFYNEKGDEAGGLQYVSTEKDGKHVAGTFMAFDKYNGDQVIGIASQEGDGKRFVGFSVWDQPDASPEEQKKNWDEAHKLGPGPERDALMQQAIAHERVIIARSRDKSAGITLSDLNGRPRIRMVVGPTGEPSLEFLDASGKVTQTFPNNSGANRN